jgi:hypothetical protein
MSSLVQISAALLVLAAFVLAQTGAVTPRARSYLALNVLGATILAVDAAHTRQWGFLLLEGVWALIAGLALARSLGPRHARVD